MAQKSKPPVQSSIFLFRQEARAAALQYGYAKLQFLDSLKKGVGTVHPLGLATLIKIKETGQLVIYTENRTRTIFITAHIKRNGMFEMVRVLDEMKIVEATGAAEIEALDCYAELFDLYTVAVRKGLVA